MKRHEAEHDAAHAKEAAGDVAHLAEAVETRRGTVAAIKKTGVDMYGDRKAIDAVKDLQAATRRYLAAKYGQADSYTLDLQLKFPESMGGDRGRCDHRNSTHLINAARRARHLFGCGHHKKGETWRCAFHRNAGHVLQAFLRAPGARGLAFQEYDAQFPHEKLTLGFAGRPGGPEFYISTVDNVRNHGPGSQGSKTEADSCFAKVVGADVVERMRKQPAPKGLGFVNNKADYIVVEDVQPRPPAWCNAMGPPTRRRVDGVRARQVDATIHAARALAVCKTLGIPSKAGRQSTNWAPGPLTNFASVIIRRLHARKGCLQCIGQPCDGCPSSWPQRRQPATMS